MYIANRWTKIHENSNPDNWRHIPRKMNPADHGTRGLNPSDIPKLWLQPPDFLSTPQDSWVFAENSNNTLQEKVRIRRQNKSPENSNNDILASDEKRARNYLIKMSPNELLSGTISALLKGDNLEKGDKLMPFTPFLDDDGLLRAGGRLNKAPLTYSVKHPLGVEHVKAHLQKFFMMIGLRKVLQSLGKYCFICRRWRADIVRPKMADLLEFRFPDANKQYPFVNTRMDMFGPI
ncbi:uncharacterized protein LOC142337985 [Convolutriloba macropyga]|uniref:uncharacterized protein LOC142337985 n=1 Tax=Convolutriloba macropyga TaxID=536237 RepID=UPI003F526F87